MTDGAHVPVLKEEVLGFLEPGPGKRIVDGTFGFGGHAEELLAAGAEVLGLDLDAEAVAHCRRFAADRPRLRCLHLSFRHLDRALAEVGWERPDGLLLDLGVSSRQLDTPHKGFSYRSDGPLDLRFDQEVGPTAAELLTTLDTNALADLLWRYGEERYSRRIARAVITASEQAELRTTAELSTAVMAALPRGVAPATVLSRIFQALRIAVNDELEALSDVLAQAAVCLGSGARVVVIAYHSLEDRIVKQWIDRERRDCICPPELPSCVCGHRRILRRLTRRVVRPTAGEQRHNRRSRSARLRAVEMTG